MALNASLHLAWMLNPNLSEADVMEMVRRDCEETVKRADRLCDAAIEIRDKYGAKEALRFMNESAWLLFL